MMEKGSPLVTVIIPSFNHARYIAEAIDSVTGQSYAPIELIVVDDGSTDDSHVVLRGYQGRPEITVILNRRNRGQGAVLNQALALARGALICFLPSDDWYLPDKVALQVRRFQDCPDQVGVVYGMGLRHFEDTGESVLWQPLAPRRGWVAEALLAEGNFVYPVTPMFRRECFERVPFDEDFRAEGEAIYVKIALHYRFDYVDEVVAVMRGHGYNIGSNHKLMYFENIRYWEKFFARPGLPGNIARLRARVLSRTGVIKGLDIIVGERDFALGRRCLWRAVSERPQAILKRSVLMGLALTLLPPGLANFLLDRRRGA